jgi:hypothetical protein
MDAVKKALGHIESRSANPMTLGDVAERSLENRPLMEAIRMSDVPTVNLAPPTFRPI